MPEQAEELRPGPRLGHAHDLGARPDQEDRGGEEQWAGSGEQDPAARQDPLGLDHRRRPARRHHAGQGPPGKGHRPVVGPGREHHGTGPYPRGPAVAAHRHDALGEDAPDLRGAPHGE